MMTVRHPGISTRSSESIGGAAKRVLAAASQTKYLPDEAK
jgi:hypothetical protein